MSMRKFAALMLCSWLTAVTVEAGTTSSHTFTAESYTGSKNRQYQVYQPDNLPASPPLVMALHGCSQTQQDVLNDWGLKAAADRYGFVLVTPFITSYDGLRNTNCWGFWFEAERHEGAGEVEDLRSIATEVESQYQTNPAQRFITGLSSGGAMTVVAAVAHNEFWTAAASAAGLPYGEDAASVSLSGQCPGYATFHSVSQVASAMNAELDDSRKIPLMVLQNQNDCTVLQQAALNIRDAHLQVFGNSGFTTATAALAQSDSCSPYYQNNYSCQHNRYTSDGTPSGDSIVETVILDGPTSTPNTQDTDHGHYWVSGEDGNNGKWSVRIGPSYPDIIWDFFARQAAITSADLPVCTVLGDNPQSLNLNDTFIDAGASCQDTTGALAVTTQCSVDSSVAGSYQCSYSATNADGTTTAVRQIEVIDPNAPLETCLTADSSSSDHIAAGRAVTGGLYSLRAISTGDQQDIGYAYDSWGSVTLTEGEVGSWYATAPAACDGSGGSGSGSGSGNGSGSGGTGFQCQETYDSLLNHQLASRAYYQLGYYSVGADDLLGSISGAYVWVKETSSGYFEAGQCD